MKTKTLQPLESSYQTDKQYKQRFDELKAFFKDNTYIRFNKYDLSLRYQEQSEGLRWFHQKKYLVEVIVNANNYKDNRTHQNIASFVLFSNYDDAMLHMVLTESRALQIIEKERI